MTNDIDVNMEPLAGYRLIERIGAGGYGEVWRAEAPGGLTKAIKFVFGKQHEKRATNELRALDHVRAVRHPFLLSLERIEVVDGRLLVVTELAEGSVKDRFDICRRDGLIGIPREELTSYLRDAADALDFMNNTHSLQHLDIKPENLLLLAGYVKVADFGLVKDVRQSQASLVGGMTPLYAAPEVFRGAPSRQSDQYSLAIVYQEMLTGTLPFVGSSAAELTLHHLNDEPDLAALSPADRYCVSRALSKDPQYRYPSCREFVDSLIKSATATSAAVSGASESAAASSFSPPSNYIDPKERETQTAFFDDEHSDNWGTQSAPVLLNAPESDCRLVDLPPVSLAEHDSRPVPTLILGIGGAAGRVLVQYRRILNARYGSSKEIPAVQMLLLDTDPRVATDVARDDTAVLTADEVLNLPLRRPQHYRENSQQLLHWLSRRWLYNIPRSLRTEGLRPLGRLALADHARVAGQRIRRAMVQSLDPAGLAKSSATVGQGFRNDSLRVVVVASISGGTGSGMSIDIGYAVRAILQKLGLTQSEIVGIMLHSTGRDARQSELARVNAFSWLTEFRHFQSFENSYPGDVSCGLPGHTAGVAAFDHTYLVQLGENLDAPEFDQATEGVAEYIRLNTLSSASAFFAASRSASAGDASPRAAGNIRSFGVYRHTTTPPECAEELTSLVTQQVLAGWRGAGVPTDLPAETDCSSMVQSLRLDMAGIAGNVRTLVERELKMEPAPFFAAWLKKCPTSGKSQILDCVSGIDQLFGRGQTPAGAQLEAVLLGKRVADIVAPLAEQLCAEVQSWTLARVEEPRHRVAGARAALLWSSRHFARVRSELDRINSKLAEQLIKLRNELGSEAQYAASGIASSDSVTKLAQFFELSLDQVTLLAAGHVVALLEADAKGVADQLTSLGREVDQIAAAANRSGSDNEQPSDTSTRLALSLQSRLPELAFRVDAQLQAEYLEANGGLLRTIMQGGRPRAQLSAKLHELARRGASQILAEGASPDGAPSASSLNIHTALAMATPSFLEYGGQRRVLAILPSTSAEAVGESNACQELGASANIVHGTDPDLTICVEADALSLEHIALDFVEQRRDRVEFAGRVHARTDVAWNPLINPDMAVTPDVWGGDTSRQTQSHQAMSKTMVM